jgi:hypothetical protein
LENPTSYAALRTADAVYVEYADGEVEYHDIAKDPDELTNGAESLAPAKRERLHEILRANRECRGAEPCWNAQRMTP